MENALVRIKEAENTNGFSEQSDNVWENRSQKFRKLDAFPLDSPEISSYPSEDDIESISCELVSH